MGIMLGRRRAADQREALRGIAGYFIGEGYARLVSGGCCGVYRGVAWGGTRRAASVSGYHVAWGGRRRTVCEQGVLRIIAGVVRDVT